MAGRSYHIVDLSDPAHPTIAGCWWIPGTKAGDADPWDVASTGTMDNTTGHTITTIGVHGAIPHGDRSYVSCLDAGFALLDISDLRQPQGPRACELVSPLRRLPAHLPAAARAAASSSAPVRRCAPPWRPTATSASGWSTCATSAKPVVISSFPRPQPPAGSPWATVLGPPRRVGPHNLHENRPGSFQSEQVIFSTWNNAGLRLHDIGDPDRPTEIAHFNPEPPPGQDAPKANDVYVDADGLIYLTDRFQRWPVRGRVYRATEVENRRLVVGGHPSPGRFRGGPFPPLPRGEAGRA